MHTIWLNPALHPDRWGVLRHRDYRLFWLGQAVSGVGTFMQVVGQSLLVLDLSGGSALALGLVSLAQALAFFAFALIGGSVVDRVDRRRLLFVTQRLSGKWRIRQRQHVAGQKRRVGEAYDE